MITAGNLLHNTISPSSLKKNHNDPSGNMRPPLFHNLYTHPYQKDRPREITQLEKRLLLNFIKNHLELHNSIITPKDIMDSSLNDDLLCIADSLEQTIQQLNSMTSNIQEQLEIISNHLKQH